MISREQIERRLEHLKAEREQVRADLCAYSGAIQDCEYWLSVLDEESEEGVAKASPHSSGGD